MSKIPSITWAQNKNKLYINIILEPKEYNVNIDEDNNLNFKQDDYEFKFKLFDNVDKNSLKIKSNRNLELDVNKVDNTMWTTLTSDIIYKNNISLDWNRWEDEDDDNDLFENNLSNDINARDIDPSLFDNLSEEQIKDLIIKSNEMRQ